MTERDALFLLIGMNVGSFIAIAIVVFTAIGWVWKNSDAGEKG